MNEFRSSLLELFPKFSEFAWRSSHYSLPVFIHLSFKVNVSLFYRLVFFIEVFILLWDLSTVVINTLNSLYPHLFFGLNFIHALWVNSPHIVKYTHIFPVLVWHNEPVGSTFTVVTKRARKRTKQKLPSGANILVPCCQHYWNHDPIHRCL